MARNTGPKHRICRLFGEKLCEAEKCPVVRRPYRTGQHWQRRSRISEYGTQLREKQKAKAIYGLMEKQFKLTYDKASKDSGITGTRLLQLLELRIDNVIYRLGFAQTRRQARQIVRHGFVSINAQKVDIPSYIVKVGDVIAIRDNKKSKKHWDALLTSLAKYQAPEWLELNSKDLTGKILTVPSGEMLDDRINTKLIIEFYSRK